MCILSVASNGGRQCAETALASVEVSQCALEISRTKIRPALLGEVQLRVRAFPQQEVAQPALPAGAYQQVDIGTQASGIARRGFDGLTSRIIDGEAQVQPSAAVRQSLRGLDLPHERSRQAVAPSDDG